MARRDVASDAVGARRRRSCLVGCCGRAAYARLRRNSMDRSPSARASKGAEKAKKAMDIKITDDEEQRARPEDQRQGARALRRRPEPRGPQIRGARRHPPRPGGHPAVAALEVHRARHRRGQRVCRAGRLRPHHPGRARDSSPNEAELAACWDTRWCTSPTSTRSRRSKNQSQDQSGDRAAPRRRAADSRAGPGEAGRCRVRHGAGRFRTRRGDWKQTASG